MFGYTFNYQGNVIPKGIYRLYTTYTNTGFRMMDNDITRDLYIRGSQNWFFYIFVYIYQNNENFEFEYKNASDNT